MSESFQSLKDKVQEDLTLASPGYSDVARLLELFTDALGQDRV